MEPDLVIHKWPCNKFGGFNEINSNYKKFLNNKIIPLENNKTYLNKFNVVYFSQLVIIILVIFAIYILYMRYQTRLTKGEKEKLIVDLYNKVHENI